MRQADWDLFDLVQDKITGIADEIEFVQSLLEDRDNLTDGHLNRGLTNEGLAQLGNYASKYNIYMSQAEKYANEIKKIEADIAKDPANKDLIDRKEELIKAQRDVILSANDEKKSMIDLARDGYDAMLEVTIDKMLQIAQAEANKNIATANNPNGVANGSSSTASKPHATPKANTSNNSSAQAPKASPNVGTRVNATGNWYYDSYGTAPTGNVNRFKPDYFEIDKIVNGRAYPYHIQAIIRGKRAGGNGWVKGNQIGYKNGLKEATYDHLAWTQEEGAEIIRRSDGSILTPITRGTTVFTREMTDNLWNIAKQNPEKFYQNAMPTMNTFATTNRGGDVTVSIGDIKLDGIQNPDQFAQALIGVVKDYSKVQKVLQAATVDLVAGKSIKDINRF